MRSTERVLTLMPLAWMGTWVAATGRRFRQVFVLAILMAAITLTNWIAAWPLVLTLALMMAGGGRHSGVSEIAPLPCRCNRLWTGVLLADADLHLDNRYTGTLEQKAFGVVSVLKWAGTSGLLWKNRV